jgi:phytoene dehydrogenase-like protein
MTERVEAQIERFAPGFRDTILARSVRSPSTIERENENLVGGDVGGGSNALLNLIFRPTWRLMQRRSAACISVRRRHRQVAACME